jgi:hypothetical protein
VIPHDAWCSPVWTAEGLPSMFGAGSQRQWRWQHGRGSACSLSVSWHGKDLYGLGVQDAKVSTLLGASPLPSVATVSQQGP